jgi:hypothetical protein
VVGISLFKTICLYGKAGMDHVIEHRTQTAESRTCTSGIFVF